MNKKEFMIKCSLLGVSEKKANDLYSKYVNNAVGKVQQPSSVDIKIPKKIPTPKINYNVDTSKISVDQMKKAAFNFGVSDAINILLNGK